jgi:site-specific DNA-methyltransferase (adenine-specific)
MGKRWDYDVPSVEVWAECLRVLKHGGHLLAFAGTRTQHRMAVRIEDAGFEIRDMIAWVYGSGFPKSLDVSKAIDKAAGAEREVVGSKVTGGIKRARPNNAEGFSNPYTVGQTAVPVTTPATPEAKQWEGWGTALKPALEPITVARKPLIGTVAENVLQHGTGAINVDGCRVGKRWPANFIHDGSEEATDLLGDSARFFYCAKASKADRDKGCEGLEERKAGAMSGIETREGKPTNHPMRTNFHPTVKPTDLMRYLCRLVTPPNGIVLDPFMGSGSTGKAAMLEGFAFVGIEREAEYVEIAKARIEAVKNLF